MSNTNILAELQRETQWVRLSEEFQTGEASRLSQLAHEYRQRITELESELAAAIEALRPFGKALLWSEVSDRYFTECDVPHDKFKTARELVTAHDARQSAGQPAAVPAGDSNENGA